MSMGLLADMQGLTKLPGASRRSRMSTIPPGKHSRTLRRPAAPVMACPVWSGLFSSDGSTSSSLRSSQDLMNSRSVDMDAPWPRPVARSQSVSHLDVRPGTSQAASRDFAGFLDMRPGTSQSQMSLSTIADLRPRNSNLTSLQMSLDEVETMGNMVCGLLDGMGPGTCQPQRSLTNVDTRPFNSQFTSLRMSPSEIDNMERSMRCDGLWWEWQQLGPRGWERCKSEASAELEEAYVLGEPTCRGFDLDALRSDAPGDIRRVRWPPRADAAVPEPACSLWDPGASTSESATLEDAGKPTVQEASKSQLRKVAGMSASTLAWPPIWKPVAVGVRASSAAGGQKRAPRRIQAAYEEQGTF